jgi:hypothetical protein
MGEYQERIAICHEVADWILKKIQEKKSMENKTTKRRKPLILVVMAALLAVIFAMAGTTFAKYVSSATIQTQTATVAKWGYVINTDTSNLWGTDYVYKDTASQVTDGTGITIKSSSENKVVAPGSKGSLTVKVSGEAEVLSAVTVSTTAATPIALTKTAKGETVSYEPIQWTVSGTAVVGTGDSANDLLANKTLTNLSLSELKTLLDGLTASNIAPGTTVAIDLTIGWEWAYSTDGNDQNDTDLGALIAGSTAKGSAEGTTAMSFGLSVQVEQLAAQVV